MWIEVHVMGCFFKGNKMYDIGLSMDDKADVVQSLHLRNADEIAYQLQDVPPVSETMTGRGSSIGLYDPQQSPETSKSVRDGANGSS